MIRFTSAPGPVGAPAPGTVDTGPQTASVPMLLLRAAMVPVLVVTVAACAISALSSGAALTGALLGAGLAAVAFSVGPAVMSVAGTWSPPAVMASALAAYLTLVVLLGAIFAWLRSQPWLSTTHLGWTLLLTAAAAVAGQARATSRLRVLAFGSPPGEADTENPGQEAERGGPHTGRD